MYARSDDEGHTAGVMHRTGNAVAVGPISRDHDHMHPAERSSKILARTELAHRQVTGTSGAHTNCDGRHSIGGEHEDIARWNDCHAAKFTLLS